ncbi:MAG: hypothetical protein ACXV74_00405 [Methylobacter sp.]
MKNKMVIMVALLLGGCANLKYPGWQAVQIVGTVDQQPCELKLRPTEFCDDDDCPEWFKKRATIYHANTIVRYGSNYASYFYCSAGLPLYQDTRKQAHVEKPKAPEKCTPKHDEKYQQESRVNIKGYYIGMEKCEIEESLGSPDRSFSVVGITVGEPQTEFIEGKLSSFYVQMPSSTFYRLQSAIQSKFPDTKCKDSVIHNRMNASFEQTECTLVFEKGNLIIKRYTSDTTNSSLSLISNEALQKMLMDEYAKQKDI